MNLEEDTRDKNCEVFHFIIPTLISKQNQTLAVPIEIPYPGLIPELTQRLITSFRLPCYIEEELQSSLESFIKVQTIDYYDKVAVKAIENARSNTIDVEDVIKKWEKLFKEETVDYGDRRPTSDSEVFSNVYHKLVHSGPALQMMLQVEQSYALAVSHLMHERNEQISALTAQQTIEMNAALDKVDVWKDNNETYINEMVAKHFEDQNMLQGCWNSEVDMLKETQREEYREWIMKLLEENQTVGLSPLYSPTTHAEPVLFPGNQTSETCPQPIMEESFTIHLGSQMKQMHNIRIMSADILDFCRLQLQTSDVSNPSPHRLQTALGLYSNDLCGLVLLNDNNELCESSLTKAFYEICDNSTEFHFQSISEQLEGLKVQIKEAVTWRNSCQHSGNLTASEQQSRRCGSKHLQTGDVFLTKHSNLASVHIIFHMIVDDSLRSSEITSRHPAILGLRNILKSACSNDITTLTIPVLLMHEMTEEMTVLWCTKRAELVFKCVKGFMIEMASWGGSELKNLQFLVPKGISEEVFSILATMLPSIFRVSNPLVFKATSTPSTPKLQITK